MLRRFVISPFFILLTSLTQSYGLEIKFRVLIEPGVTDCFFQNFPKGVEIYNEIQVVLGSDLDISFSVHSPPKRIIHQDKNIRHSQVNFKTSDQGEGEYQFCFDNTHSTFTNKHVNFYLTTNSNYEDPHLDFNTNKANIIKDDLGEEYKEATSSIDAQLSKVKFNLDVSERHLESYKAYELADRETAEENFTRVNFWSVVYIIVLITVSLVQVITIKSLFETKSKLGKALREN